MGLTAAIPGLGRHRTVVEAPGYDVQRAKSMADRVFIWIMEAPCFLPWLEEREPGQFEAIRRAHKDMDGADLREDLIALERACDRAMVAQRQGLQMFSQQEGVLGDGGQHGFEFS